MFEQIARQLNYGSPVLLTFPKTQNQFGTVLSSKILNAKAEIIKKKINQQI